MEWISHSYSLPGQEVEAHTHPGGQDTCIMVQGELIILEMEKPKVFMPVKLMFNHLENATLS